MRINLAGGLRLPFASLAAALSTVLASCAGAAPGSPAVWGAGGGASPAGRALTASQLAASPAAGAPGGAVAAPVDSGGTRGAKTAVLTPEASGKTLYENSSAAIDASNVSQGYVMVKYTGGNKKVKLQISKGGGTKYTYNLRAGAGYEAFPLTGGNGSYNVNVFENAGGDQYALALGQAVDVELDSPLLPYLYPSQYVNFTAASAAVQKGAQLAAGTATDLEVVQNVYDYVINNVSYDLDKVSTVTSGYLPDPDVTLRTGKGICFDYAALMATMLRSQSIPTRLEVGYAGGVYHAWVSVYLSEVGWVNGIIHFDGKNWTLMDPTFASSGKGDESITEFIGNGSNYSTKYVY